MGIAKFRHLGGVAMRSLLLGTVLLAIAGPAVAADMPVKAPRLEPIFSWTGCYFGATGGGYQAKSDFTGLPTGAFPTGEPTIIPNLSAVSSGTLKKSGFIGGGEAGCNVLNDNHVLLGFEIDASDLSFSQASVATGPGDPLAPGTTLTSTQSVTANWLTTFRARIGVTNDRWLFYTTGGIAVANVTFSQSVFFSASGATMAGSNTAFAVGWTAGGGIEYAVTNNWSVKGEYLYADLGSQSVNELFLVGFPTFMQLARNDVKLSIARLGVNFRW